MGGNLMYLGGNGWYWRIVWDKKFPGIIEIRRAEGGVRSWEAEAGEYYHSFNGEYGGIWRRLGRAPNKLLGIRKDLTPEKMSKLAKKYKDEGATILGGCCETKPQHIKEMAKLVKII